MELNYHDCDTVVKCAFILLGFAFQGEMSILFAK